MLFSTYLKILLLAMGLSLGAGCEKKKDVSSSGESQSSGASTGDVAAEEPAEDDGEDAFKEFEETKKPKPPSLAQVLEEECGLPEPLNTNAIILDQVMINPYERVIKSGLLDVYIPIHTSIIMKNTQARSDFTIELDIQEEGVRADYHGVAVDASRVLVQGQTEARLFTGTTSNFAPEQDNPIPEEWADLVCTVSFVGRSVTTIGGNRTVIKYTPPLPTGVSPNPIAERFDSELGRARHFFGITAEIIETNNPRLTVGQKITGSVFMERLPSTRVTPRMDLKGNVAFRVTNSFRNRQTTADLGMLLWSEIYIDHETQEYANFASDLGTDLQYLYKEGAQPFPSSFEGAQP